MIHHNYSKIGEVSEKLESGMKSLKDELNGEINVEKLRTERVEGRLDRRLIEKIDEETEETLKEASETAESVENLLQDMNKSKGVVKD